MCVQAENVPFVRCRVARSARAWCDLTLSTLILVCVKLSFCSLAYISLKMCCDLRECSPRHAPHTARVHVPGPFVRVIRTFYGQHWTSALFEQGTTTRVLRRSRTNKLARTEATRSRGNSAHTKHKRRQPKSQRWISPTRQGGSARASVRACDLSSTPVWRLLSTCVSAIGE